MKSYVELIQGLYGHILADMSDWYPSLREDFDRDKVRLLALGEDRGLSFFTIELPEAGKHFEECLSSRSYYPSRMAGLRPFRSGVVIPRLFKGLLLRVFTEFGELRVDADVHAVRCLRQLFYAAKKVRMECTHERTATAIREWFSVERAIRSPTFKWDEDVLGCQGDIHFGDNLDNSQDSSSGYLFPSEEVDASTNDSLYASGILDILQDVSDQVSAQMGVFDPLLWRPKHGPGVVSDLSGRVVRKYDFPYWPNKLERIFPLADFAYANYALWADEANDGSLGRMLRPGEPPSRLIAVPKTQKGPRLIAAEPTSHQWCQQVVKDFLVSRVSKSVLSGAIDFFDQSLNQRSALRASATSESWTVDLSSASDRLGCYVVERIFRRNTSLLDALHACRTRWITQSIDPTSPTFHRLKKFSTMGSAVTFPVQSIVFCIIAVSAVLYARHWPASYSNIRAVAQEVRVFGDDIIIPKVGGLPLLGLLRYLGFQVNRSKTFRIGNFRESCGCDAFMGADVTPVYTLTYPARVRPESVASTVDVHNNWYSAGYYRTSRWLKSETLRIRKDLAIPNVAPGSGVFGWETHEPIDNSHLRKKWDADRQHLVHCVSLPLAKRTRVPHERFSALLQYYVEAPPPTTLWESGYSELRPSLRLGRRWVQI